MRVRNILDAESYAPLPTPAGERDPLSFDDGMPYRTRLEHERTSKQVDEVFHAATGTINGIPAAVAAMEFSFFGGSLGEAAGLQFLTVCKAAVQRGLPLVCFCSSGGARMQEGLVSLMQMARCTAAVSLLADASLPYMTILCDPCFGGVSASFAAQADIILAEPHARIGFAGGRVIEQASHGKLPAGFQTAEFILEHGMVDMICERKEIKSVVATLLGALEQEGHARSS